MNELEALKKTRNRWMRLKAESRDRYIFCCLNCDLCRYDDQFSNEECDECPWYKAFDSDGRLEADCVGWTEYFSNAQTTQEAEIWQTAIIGMLEYLIEEGNRL